MRPGNGPECGNAGFPKFPGKRDEIESGINLERQWLIGPIEEVRICADAELRDLGRVVIAPAGLNTSA